MLKRHSKLPTAERGFALVAALLILPLLAMLCVGLLGLSSIEIRKSSSQIARSQAQANARLALSIAIGQLQKQLGPDQRVSADSRILEGEGSSGDSSLKQPHWVNVWGTTREDGKPYITRNGENGGLSDSRAGGFNAADERLSCLVSGNESEMAYYDGRQSNVPDEDELVELVGQASVGSVRENDRVSAPRVDLMEGEAQRGSYAWWVGDLGARANIATPDGSQLGGSRFGGVRASLLSQDASFAAINNQEDLPNEHRSKTLSTGQVTLASGNKDAAKESFHDITTDSVGLLVDVRDGGLKKDLTAYLNSNGSIPDLGSGDTASIGISDQDRLVGPRNAKADAASANPGQAGRFSKVAPNFGLLRDWAQRSEDATYGTNFNTKADFGTPANRGGSGVLSKAVAYKNRTQTDLKPVLVEGSLYYNLSFYDTKVADSKTPYGLRVHFYPRVVLWNPYNFEMDLGASMVNFHMNGKKWVEVELPATAPEPRQVFRMHWGEADPNLSVSGGHNQGKMYFKLNGATLGPGETLVWSPAANKAYDQFAFSNNVLTAESAPSPTRAFYQDSRQEDGHPLFTIWPQERRPPPHRKDDRLPARPVGWREYVFPGTGGNVQAGNHTQADDYLIIWKPITGGASSIDSKGFAALPLGRYISCSWQYGDEDEMPVSWSQRDLVTPFPETTTSMVVSAEPDRRTRDGFRLRWFNETESNRIGSGQLSNTPHLESAPVANWNMRSSYAFRNPFDNVTDKAPNFFGIYTRDLFDGEVSFSRISPRYKGGKNHGDPFGQPIRFDSPRILFDIPRAGTEIASLGAFQHASMSEFIWHPTYAIGNSLADPRIELNNTEPDLSDRKNRDKGGWNGDTIGWTADGRSNSGNETIPREDSWAHGARGILEQSAVDQTLIYDLSYELNQSLWDTFFLSSGNVSEKSSFVRDPNASPLPNGRMRVVAEGENLENDISDFHRAASRLAVDGAFNVNSTSVTAWEAMLLSNMDTLYGSHVAFPRILGLQGAEWDGSSADEEGAWSGQRTFDKGEIRKLAEEIVREVKTRGPFLSLSDFVNRRLTTAETGKKGALQAAIDRAGLNSSFEQDFPLNNRSSLPDYNHPDHIVDPTRMEQTHMPSTMGWGALGFLTQADVLQFLGPALSARSDSFVVRAYGSTTSADGKIEAEAWCEAVVQRTPTPINPDQNGMNPRKDSDGTDSFGRRFEISRFRWLTREEV